MLMQAELVAAEVAPLLRELRNGELFTRLEALTEVATSTAADIRCLSRFSYFFSHNRLLLFMTCTVQVVGAYCRMFMVITYLA